MAPPVAHLEPDDHLKIALTMAEADCHDAGQKYDRLVQIIEFARDADWTAPLLIHCRLGISRSPAAAFMIQCALAPNKSETEIAMAMRNASTEVDPSFSIIAEADDMLGRDGRMLDAVDAMGPSSGRFAQSIMAVDFVPSP